MRDLAILYIGAHPDDEGSAGGSLALYAAAGVRAYVACATRGDGRDAQIKNEAATRETLGAVRSTELTRACEVLGLQPPFFLGHQDGEVDKVDVESAAQAVARLIQDIRAAIVITHGPEGGYGHPDHITVNRFVTRAFELARASDAPPLKLYYTAMPRSFLEQVPAFRDRRADIRGQQLGFVGVEDDKITTAINVQEWTSKKLAALACHRTQFDLDPDTGRPKTFVTSIPEDQQRALFGYERYVLAQNDVPGYALPAGPQAETDLLAGLVEGGSVIPALK